MQTPRDIYRKRPLVFREIWDAMPGGVRQALAKRAPAGSAQPAAVRMIEQTAQCPKTRDGMIVIHPTAHRRAS